MSNGLNGAGLIRGVLCRACNVSEGKIWNLLRRYEGLEHSADKALWLSKLIAYYEQGTTDILHPSERVKRVLSKRNYNTLKRLRDKQGLKTPEYPKSKRLTKSLAKLFNEHQIEPFN